ncbi:hypothetical protein BO70DRAFT_377363 [Aspergillus heteromorphus CBS 117.55]|uniref:Hydrophobic surface binding protein A n=1 Tax=Aspergillus heteromorphus CBS 117.55 TaxID=1448321 RepID=A0A317WUU3_9EURO|nr:uncharacterized protein BO70DRAFT_377363 [Aspergillus heteromorphus CBS 117.55]PWY90194.1 hypothetical protein BO70DRAFT_377363 [Aspergillus heteromorphus CBS 117.55]
MKFTGIATSLALASTVSAAALPARGVEVTVQSTLTELTGVLGNLDNVVDNLLGCVTDSTDLTEVKSKLSTIQGQLTELLPVSKRDLTGTVVDVAAPVKAVAGNAVNTVGGVAAGVAATEVDVKRDGDSLTTLSQNIVDKVESGDLDAAGLENVLSLLNVSGSLVNVQAALALL